MVLLLMLLGTALITFTLPESFVGVARVRTTTPDRAEIFQSKAVLAIVVEQLDLTRRFAQRYGVGEPLSLDRSLYLLRRELQVRRIRNAEITEIRAYSRIPKEAAEFANAIAQTGITNAVFTSSAVDTGSPRILELAVPGFKPVRPNKLLNYGFGTCREPARSHGRGTGCEAGPGIWPRESDPAGESRNRTPSFRAIISHAWSGRRCYVALHESGDLDSTATGKPGNPTAPPGATRLTLESAQGAGRL